MNSQQEDRIREDKTYNHYNAHQKKASKAAEQMNEQGIVSSEDRNGQAKVPDSLAGFLNKSRTSVCAKDHPLLVIIHELKDHIALL